MKHINFKKALPSMLPAMTMVMLLLSLAQTPAQAQEPLLFTKPTWWIGAAVGANFNFYRGTTQELNLDITTPAPFHHGSGVGLFLAPMVEYRRPDSKFGGMLQLGYDGRGGSFDYVMTPCDCRGDLKTNLRYFTIEPSLRYNPFPSRSSFYIFGGPRIAFNVSKSFTYSQKANPASVEQVAEVDVKGDFSSIYGTLLSMQVGAGYDIPLTAPAKQTQIILAPFVSFQPYFGQSPRSIETWTVTTLRAGAALKFGRGSLMPPKASGDGGIVDPLVNFSVVSPANVPVERRVRETFPLRNYVFFDLESTEIPDRYVLLSKDQVRDFKEDQLEVFTPKKLSGRSGREMVVYYNVLNILGDRMGRNPDASIALVGSSEKGPDDGRMMAESVKKYLTTVFGISATRIAIEGRTKPKIPSEKAGGTMDIKLLREGDRRVSIESKSPALLMEFQSGPDAPLKPVEFVAVQTAPLDSYIQLNVAGKEAFTSWRVETRSETGEVKYFGPYMQEFASIPGKDILGTRPEGTYTITMIGTTKGGKTITRDAVTHMVLWTPAKDEEGMRFSVIFEFDDSKAIAIYQKYLTEIVTPKIPKNGKVIIHGHTDIIGEDAYNRTLSTARANEVKTIIQSALLAAGRTDVTFESFGFGEDESVSPFENNFPEERFYNRTVIIDIIPRK